MKKKSGFTLIELLAVIVILAILALIISPVITGIIKTARKSAFRASALAYAEAAKNKCSNDKLKGTDGSFTVIKENGIDTGLSTISEYATGKEPDKLEIKTKDNCSSSLALYSESLHLCAYKNYDDKDFLVVDVSEPDRCEIGNVKEDNAPVFTGYSCSNPGETVAAEEKYFTFDQTTGTITGYSTDGPKDLVIPCTIGGKNVETIGSNAFSRKGLTSVKMPDTIKTINNSAFAYNSIKTLELGNSVETIGDNAFYVNSITNLVFPDSLKTIQNTQGWRSSAYYYGAFEYNPLSTVQFGAGIESIGAYTFACDGFCNNYPVSKFTSIDFSRTSKLKSIGANAFSGYFNWGNAGEIDLSNNHELTSIGDNAFLHQGVTKLKLDSSNLTIGNGAFSENNVNQLNIDGDNIVISESAFYGNKIAEVSLNATNVKVETNSFSNNLIEDINFDNILSIGDNAFKNNQLPDDKAFVMNRDSSGNPTNVLNSYGGANRSNIVIPDNVTDISKASFSGLGLTGKLNTGNGIVSLPARIFSGNSLTNVVLGSSMKTVNECAFDNNKISSIDFGNSVETITTGAFRYNRLVNLEFPDSLKTLSNNEWSYDDQYGAFIDNPIQTIKFGSGIETIGNYTFGCFSSSYPHPTFTSIDFSRAVNLKTIGNRAFYSGGSVPIIDLGNSTKLSSVGAAAFQYLPIKELKLNGTNLTVNEYAFSYDGINSLDIKGTTINLKENAFTSNKISTLNIDATGVTIGKGVFSGNLLEELNLNGVVSIGADAFKNNQLPDDKAFVMNRDSDGNPTTSLNSYAGKNRSNISIPDSITDISGASFSGLGLTGTLNTGNGVSNITNYKFSSNSLTNVIIGNSVKTIGAGAFDYNKIATVDFGTSVESMTNGAFRHNNLTNLVLPDSLKYLSNTSGYDNQYGVFLDNPIKTIVFGSGIQTIGNYTFGCFSSSSPHPSFTSIDFSKAINLKSIGNRAFYSSGSLSEINLGNSSNLGYIGEGAFEYLPITSLKLNGTNLTVAQYAFAYSNMISLDIKGANITLNQNAFASNKLTSLNINASGVKIGTGVFASNLLEELNLNGVVSMGADAFKNNQLPDDKAFVMNVDADGNPTTVLNSYAGANRSNIVIPNSITDISAASFSSLGLTGTLNLGNGMDSIDTYKFSGNSLTSLILGNTIKTINEGAFENNKLVNINFGNSLETINRSAFSQNKIVNLEFPDSLKYINNGGGYEDQTGAFGRNPIQKVVFGSGIISIGASTFHSFRGEGDLANFQLIDFDRAVNLKTIGNYAFSTSYSNGSTFTLNIPASVTSIGAQAFYGVNTADKIFVRGKMDASNFASLGDYWNGSITNIVYELSSCFTHSGSVITGYADVCSKSLVIPDTLDGDAITSIGNDAFKDKSLINATIPAAITSIGSNAFSGNSLSVISVSAKTSSSDFASLGDNWNGDVHVVYENNQTTCNKVNGTELTGYYSSSTVCNRNAIIPSSITSIAENAYNGVLLDSITVNDGTRLSSVGNNWNGTVYKVNFDGDSYEYNCFTLDGTKITGYKKYCKADIDLSNNIQGKTINEVGDNAFNNSSITSIILGSNITKLGTNAFANNDITNVTLVDGLNVIGDSTFYNTGLLNAYIPSTVTSIGANAFAGNSSLGTITVYGKSSLSNFSSLGDNWNGTGKVSYSN